jgi:hypothetical protein
LAGNRESENDSGHSGSPTWRDSSSNSSLSQGLNLKTRVPDLYDTAHTVRRLGPKPLGISADPAVKSPGRLPLPTVINSCLQMPAKG